MQSHQALGEVIALWRYPVKSMQGEAIEASAVGARGLLGDRGYAVIERATGHVASAKHPRKWGMLFACRAVFAATPQPGAALPPVLITLPDQTTISSAQPDIDAVLSRVCGCEVTLLAEAPAAPIRESNRTPIDAPEGQETITQEPMAIASPAGTFFDYAPTHLLTTATLRRFEELYPAGVFATSRFRPNIVIAPAQAERGFVENDWIGRTLVIGATAQIIIIDPTPRCVVTTLAQGDLARDPGILRTVSQHNAAPSATLAPGVVFPAVAGVYGRASNDAMIRCGDVVWSA